MPQEPLGTDEILRGLANLEGQVRASRVMNGMLLYALRTNTPIEVVFRDTDRLREGLAEEMQTFLPDHRGAFTAGVRDGMISIQVIAAVINSFMDDISHATPPENDEFSP